MKQMILYALSAILLCISILNALTSNYNFGNLLVWLLTAACLLYTFLWRRIDLFLNTKVGTVCKAVVAVGCVFFLIVLGVILSGQWGSKPDGNEKAVIVLGCAVHGETPSMVLVQRLQTAYEYHLQNPDAWIVVCGGQGPGEDIPEAEAMRRWLVQKGVPDDKILCENKSTSTEENLAFAKAILEEQGIGADTPVVYVSNGFHCYRAGRYAADVGYTNAAALPAAIVPSQILPCYLREVFAVVYYWVFKSPHTGFLKGLVGMIELVGQNPAFFK